MNICKAYSFSMEELEEILQNMLDDGGLKVHRYDNSQILCYAQSDTQFLDAGQIDERLAQHLQVGFGVGYYTGDESFVFIVENDCENEAKTPYIQR